MNIYPVFHISFLELVLLEVLLAPITEIELVNPNTEYKIRNYIKVSSQINRLFIFGKYIKN
jgi:hypothetical protein